MTNSHLVIFIIVFVFDLNCHMTVAKHNQSNLDTTHELTFFPSPFTTSNSDNGALTWSFGVIYRPFPTWSVFINLFIRFLTPNADDTNKIFNFTPNTMNVPIPSF